MKEHLHSGKNFLCSMGVPWMKVSLYAACHEYETAKEKSRVVDPGIEPMTLCTLVGCCTAQTELRGVSWWAVGHMLPTTTNWQMLVMTDPHLPYFSLFLTNSFFFTLSHFPLFARFQLISIRCTHVPAKQNSAFITCWRWWGLSDTLAWITTYRSVKRNGVVSVKLSWVPFLGN